MGGLTASILTKSSQVIRAVGATNIFCGLDGAARTLPVPKRDKPIARVIMEKVAHKNRFRIEIIVLPP